MKNIIPFKKDITFKTNLSEITSISLENTLNLKDNTISGDFIVSGEYKVSDNSTTVEPFNLNLPFEIDIDDRFETKSAIVDIDDFYYEIINNNTLSVSIDVLVDKLSEKPIVEELPKSEQEIVVLEDEREDDNVEDNRCIEEEEVEEVKEEIKDELEEENVERKEETEMVEDKINSIFNNNTFDSDVYVAYNVFIVREGDTLESIMDKYGVSEEELKKYNDLSNLQLGDKIIIPNTDERD